MMFSILPYDYTDAGLTGSQKIEVTATIAAWDYRTDLIKPTQPVAATDPDKNDLTDLSSTSTSTTLTTQGASALIASGVAFAAVAMSLI